MIVAQNGHPPGAVCFASGEIARYGVSLQCLERLQVPNGSLLAWYMGVLVAENLNRGMNNMMDNPGLQWSWVMGDDHIFQAGVLTKLLDHGKDVIIPLCLNRYPPMDPTVVSSSRGQLRLEDFPTSGLYKLGEDEVCGDAGLLVRRSVLEKLERPFYNTQRSGSFKSEDQSFTNRLKQAGYDIWVDCETTIGHIAGVSVEPVAVNGEWRIRLTGGMKHIVDIKPQRVRPVAQLPKREAA